MKNLNVFNSKTIRHSPPYEDNITTYINNLKDIEIRLCLNVPISILKNEIEANCDFITTGEIKKVAKDYNIDLFLMLDRIKKLCNKYHLGVDYNEFNHLDDNCFLGNNFSVFERLRRLIIIYNHLRILKGEKFDNPIISFIHNNKIYFHPGTARLRSLSYLHNKNNKEYYIDIIFYFNRKSNIEHELINCSYKNISSAKEFCLAYTFNNKNDPYCFQDDYCLWLADHFYSNKLDYIVSIDKIINELNR
jgi:hypothetical protein